MKMPCPNAIRCEGSDFPITNFSSEDPDRITFISINWGWDYTTFPPIDGNIINNHNNNCVIIGESVISQQAANNCSLVAQIECANGQTAQSEAEVGCNVTPSDPNPPPIPDPPALFYNTAQVCNSLCADGSTTSFVVAAGYFAAASQVLADRIAHSYACNQARRNRVCISMPSRFCCSGSAFSSSLSASGSGPFSFSVTSGTFPTGLTLHPNGSITGTPTDPGTYSFNITAVGSLGAGTKTFTFEVLGITNDSVLPDGTTGTAYSQQLVSGGGGITFSVTNGSLPTGLSMTDAGLITGTPTVVGATTFEVTVVDAFLNQCKKDFVIDVKSSILGYYICEWPAILTQLTMEGTCGADAAPAWNGFFNNTINLLSGDPVWYFLSQSILGKACSADAPGNPYPAVGWQNASCYTALQWDGAEWLLAISCSSCGIVWFGLGPATPGDATGEYALQPAPPSSSTIPLFINIAKVTNILNLPENCLPCNLLVHNDWVYNPGACRLRIKNYVDGLFLDCQAPPGSIQPAWDGTFPNFFPPGSYGHGAANASIPPTVGVPRGDLTTINLNFNIVTHTWTLHLEADGFGPIWDGTLVSDDPTVGVFTRSLAPQCVTGPANVTIEGYI